MPPLPPPSSPPSPSGASGASSPSGAPSPAGATSQLTPGIQAFGPSAPGTPNSSTGVKSLTTNRVTWIAIAGLIICAVLGLTLCFCVPKCCKRSQPASEIAKSREMDAYNYTKVQPKIDESFSKLYSPMEKGIFIFKPFSSCSRIVLGWFWYVHPQSLIVSPFHFGMSQNVSHPGKLKKKLVNFRDLTNRTDIVEQRDIFSLLLVFLFNVSLFSWQLILGGL